MSTSGAPLDWVYRVKDDETSVLLRASANYAAKGYDPTLAAEANRRDKLAQAPETSALSAAANASHERRKARSNGPTRLPPTPYESGFTGRAVMSSLPLGATAFGDASLAMTRGPPVVKPALDIQSVPGITRRGPKTDSMGIVQGKGGVTPATAAGNSDKFISAAKRGPAHPYVGLKDVALVPTPAAQGVGSRSGEQLVPGALSYSLQDNAVGRSDACPHSQAPAANRGGAGLISGVVTVHRDAMVPAALVVAKWGRLLKSDYGTGLQDPATFTVELQPLFYESLMMDLAAVAGDRFGFKPAVEPAVFMVDVGSVNRKIHGAAAAASDRGDGDFGNELALVPLRGHTLVSTAHSHASLSSAGAGGMPRETKSRQQRREMEALCRLELRAVVKEGTERAEEYLRGVSRMGDDRELTRLLQGGYSVSYTPHPWYQRMDVDGAARDRQRRGSTGGGGVVPASRAGLLTDGRDGTGRAVRGVTAGGLNTRGRSTTPPPTAGSTALVSRGFGGAGRQSMSPPPSAPAGGEWEQGYDGAIKPHGSGRPVTGASLPLGRLGTASAVPQSAASRPGSTVVDLRGLDGDTMGSRGLPQQTLHVMPDVDSTDPDGNTALMLAAKNGWPECVKVLLAAGAEHRRKNNSGQNAYDLARIESELASVSLSADHPGAGLRKRRAALTASLLDDRSLLEVARDGDLRRVKHLVEVAGHPVNGCNTYAMTALHFAVLKRDPAMVAYLVLHGADPTARNNLGQTPMSLCMDAVGEGGAQEALLAAMNEGPLQEARRKHDSDTAADKLEQQRRANAVLARKLREYTRGTTAARAVQLSMPPGFTPDFRPIAGLVSSPSGSARSDGRVSSTVKLIAEATQGSTGASTTARRRAPTDALTPPVPNAATLSEMHRTTAALKASWNRHSLEYLSLQQKQIEIKKARDVAQHAREAGMTESEHRRFQAAGKRFTAQDAAAVVARVRAPEQSDGGGLDRTGEVLSSGAATALWATDGMLAARTSGRRTSEPLIRTAAALGDPEALTNALRTHAPAPQPTDRKFDAWMRMRFGHGALK